MLEGGFGLHQEISYFKVVVAVIPAFEIGFLQLSIDGLIVKLTQSTTPLPSP